jgi:hypothetical protein
MTHNGSSFWDLLWYPLYLYIVFKQLSAALVKQTHLRDLV